MDCEQLKKDWANEEQHAFKGWDFSHLKDRWTSAPNNWSYENIVREHLRTTDCLLDMGTGGGEFLLSLHHPYQLTSVTEAWEPNIQLCIQKLVPLGIRVYQAQNESPLPINDDSFDIVINRHETYDLHEVKRVLRPGGLFITQQVGGENCVSLKKRINLEETIQSAFSLQTELPQFQDCGFSVSYSDECFPELKFFDVGAIVFWAKIIEWSFPGFSVERNYRRLQALQKELDQNGFISSLQHRFIIVAQNMQ